MKFQKYWEKRALFLTFSLFLFSSCTSYYSCVKVANGVAIKPPCWLNDAKQEGIVLQGKKHYGKGASDGYLAARNALLDKAILEFSKRKYGVEVSVNAIILQEITAENNSVKENINHSYLAEFSTAKGTIAVKAGIKDYYYDPRTEKVWVWVMELK